MESKETVKKVLTQIKGSIERYLDSESMVSDGILDSFDIINLVMGLEEAFDIEIDPENVTAENFESVDAITALVEKCKG